MQGVAGLPSCLGNLVPCQERSFPCFAQKSLTLSLTATEPNVILNANSELALRWRSVQEMTGRDRPTGLVAQTVVFRRLRWQATENDGLPHCLVVSWTIHWRICAGRGSRFFECFVNLASVNRQKGMGENSVQTFPPRRLHNGTSGKRVIGARASASRYHRGRREAG
jgi:hypothetical protein